MIDPNIEHIIIALVSFAGGSLFGYYIRGRMDGRVSSDNHIVLLAVTTVWTVSVLVDLLTQSYQTSPLIHGLMGAIVGFFYKITPKKE